MAPNAHWLPPHTWGGHPSESSPLTSFLFLQQSITLCALISSVAQLCFSALLHPWMLPWTLFFGGSKITADGDGSRESKGCLLLGRKAMTNLDSVLKSRDITLPTKFRLVKAMVFPLVMNGCESWDYRES